MMQTAETVSGHEEASLQLQSRPDSGFPTPVICNEHPPIMTCLVTLRNPPERDNVTKAGDVSR